MDAKELMLMMVQMDNHPSYQNSHHHMNNSNIPSSDPFPSEPLQGTSAAHEVDQKSSLGFMELLGFQDYYSSPSIFDDTMTFQQLQPPTSSSLSMEMVISTSAPPLKHGHDDGDNGDIVDRNHKEENIKSVDEESSSVVLNGQPSSPNSSSISSPAARQKPLKQCMKAKETMAGSSNDVKPKKKKKEKEARFAFMTKTEIDHLDDGYRWRKYGQKAVKNSHFPRSYYRCTSAPCTVKKRVERCMGDSSYVITTYEGQHNHPVNPANSAPIIPSFSHLLTPTTAAVMPPAMIKLEQGAGLLQDMLHCYY